MNYSNLTRLPKMSIHPDVYMIGSRLMCMSFHFWHSVFYSKKKHVFLFQTSMHNRYSTQICNQFHKLLHQVHQCRRLGFLFFPQNWSEQRFSACQECLTGHEFRKAVMQPRNNLAMMNGKKVLHIVLANQAASTKQIIEVFLLVAYRKVSHCFLQWYVNIVGLVLSKKHHWFAEKTFPPLPVRNAATHLIDLSKPSNFQQNKKRCDSFEDPFDLDSNLLEASEQAVGLGEMESNLTSIFLQMGWNHWGKSSCLSP